ncbi:MAG: glycosyltransferase [Acidobacteria bacterium]|nr:glycosyltransferase [Acidobacteriota bacterium]
MTITPFGEEPQSSRRPDPIDVLHVIPYMHPRAGGPPVVVDRLCRRLASRGWRSRVVTTDAFSDDGDQAWLDPYQGGYSIEVFPGRGMGGYSYSRGLSDALDRLVTRSRLVHLHTVWSYSTWAAIRACRRQRIPYVVMPHGMLDPHSLSRKWLKKQIYGRLVEWPNLRRAAAMIYTHSAERALAESAVKGLPAGYVVPLGSDDPPDVARAVLAEGFLAARPGLRGKAIVLFLSRLHPKKGLDLLIPAFALLAANQPDAHLVVAGEGNAAYVRQLMWMAGRARLADRVTFTGALRGRAKWEALAACRVFALPSYQENFALVVIEAQRIGVPVVISRRVNIWEDLVEGGGGAACDLTPSGIADALQRWLADAAEAEAAGRRGELFVREHFNWNRAADVLCEVYEQVLSRVAGAEPGGTHGCTPLHTDVGNGKMARGAVGKVGVKG